MGIVTSIKPQKNGKRLNIYIDNEFSFGIDLENFVVLGIRINQQLTDEEILSIVKKADFQKTLDKLLRFATLRPRSKKEIEDYFKRKKVHESLHQELFNRLNRLDLIDDEKFANWWIEQRQSFKPKAKKILIQELLLKGIQKNLIKKLLDNTNINELEMAQKEIDKKSYKWESLSNFERKRKISEYLLRKGFDWETVEKVVKKQ